MQVVSRQQDFRDRPLCCRCVLASVVSKIKFARRRRSSLSSEGAAVCSPVREGGVKEGLVPHQARRAVSVLRPFGAEIVSRCEPRPYGRGYILPPLRGSTRMR